MTTPAAGRLARLRYAGIAAVAILWASIGFGMLRTGLGFFEDRPISYLGTDPKTELLFTSAMLASAVLFAAFYFFVYDWYSSSPSFLAVGLVGLVGQVVAGIVPLSGPGASHTVHATGGIVVGLSLPLLMWRFAASQPRSAWRRGSYRFFWAEVVACVIGVLLSRSMRAAVAEIIPGAGFHLWIFFMTVRSLRTAPARRRQRTRGLYLMR
ncbi:MAG: DUF998 domain-containing protein [Actinomycetota bacterium]|nr:DUF998 domain-containing protein [Actinomycetota bacterium]